MQPQTKLCLVPRLRWGVLSAVAGPVALAFCLALNSLPAQATGTQAPTAERADPTTDPSLADQVVAYLEQAALERWPDADVQVALTLVPERLRLSRCDQLQIKSRGTKAYGRLPVSLRCAAPQPWQLFVQAQVEVKVPVAIATAPVARGVPIKASDLTLAPRNLSRLRQGVVTDLKQAVGYLSSRPLANASVVYSSMLKRPITIPKGQRVAIAGGQGSIQIAAQGEAMEAGMRGDQIKVRNIQSGRELHAWVLGPGRVSSHWPKPDS